MVDAATWARHDLWWRNRAAKYGDAYVGRIGENHVQQFQRITKLLEPRLDGYYEKALDYGCGYGRFIPLLARHCGHIWAADILDAPLMRAAVTATNVTPIKVSATGLSAQPVVDLVVVIDLFHFLSDERLFTETANCVKKTAALGCRFVVIDNAVDNDYHVRARSAETLAAALGFDLKSAERVTVNCRAQDHWLLDGVKNG